LKSFDIDIDLQTTFDPLKVFPKAVKASMVNLKGELIAHPCGAYLQDVPVDARTGLAAAPFKLAEELGCFKLDFLHLNVLDKFETRADILALLEVEPDWNLLLIPSVVPDLFHVGKHADLLSQVRPTSVLELADTLALIRPQKRYIVPYYLKDRIDARKILYTKEEGEAYGFKKAHAIAYAMIIVLQLHLVKAGIKLGR
jgi:DNA polymerase III alpha subunit